MTANSERQVVRRWTPGDEVIGTMVGTYTNGPYVKSQDYDTLLSQVERMRKALEGARVEITADAGGRVWTCLKHIDAALEPV